MPITEADPQLVRPSCKPAYSCRNTTHFHNGIGDLAEQLSVVVVGAGPAGLATSRELRRRGIQHVVLERGESVGHTWANLYDSLVLHTGKHLSGFAARDRRVASRDARGLFFVGQTYDRRGGLFNIGWDAKRAARMISAELRVTDRT